MKIQSLHRKAVESTPVAVATLAICHFIHYMSKCTRRCFLSTTLTLSPSADSQWRLGSLWIERAAMGVLSALLPNSATSYILTRLVKVIEEQAMTNFPGKTNLV